MKGRVADGPAFEKLYVNFAFFEVALNKYEQLE